MDPFSPENPSLFEWKKGSGRRGCYITESNSKESLNDLNTEVSITDEDVKDEIDFWESANVCYVLGVKPLYRIINGLCVEYGKFWD